MKRKTIYQSLLIMGFATTIFTASCYATTIGVDAAYGTATHNTTNWQELNDVNNADDNYGVSWSVDGGAYGRENIVAGQTVQFQINMQKEHLGTHYADFMKLWVDWGQDNMFDASDVVLFEQKPINPDDPLNRYSSDLGSYIEPIVPDYTFLSLEYTVAGSFWGDLALRARVTCSESLLDDWGAQWDETIDYSALFSSTGRLNQGEVEDWTIAVAPVPEPATMLLFGTGLVGLAGARARRKKK